MTKRDRKKVKLLDICLNITDGTHSTIKNDDNGNYYLLSCKNIKEGNIVINNNDRRIDFQTFQNIRKRTKLSKNDILLTTVGTIGESAIIQTDVINFEFQRSVAIIKPNPEKITPHYLYNYIRNRTFQEHIIGLSRGVAQQCLFLGPLKESIIEYPESIETQQYIASILSKYDDLIENNNQRIKILEQEAELIYKERFVRFKFPGYEKVKMVDSGTEFGMIPEGWEVKSMLDIDLFRMINENIKTFDGEKVYLETANINGINIVGEGQVVSTENKPSRAQKQPIKDSVWFARMANSYKVLCFSDINKDITENILLSSGMIGFEALSNSLSFLFFTINSKFFHEKKDLFCTGSTQVSLTNEGLEQIKIIVPIKELVQKYGNACKKKIDLILNLQKENKNLRQTRDLLLPKLISGEIEV